ncbi:DMT family transporter [Leucobacter aridicollis]|uniref:Spermidine export protein MdtJ n=1 Tax=Leucobacter aridicollis TaxID=283878 RepID=A0A852R790_9MICO|nr:SMR family transporter [Leucobacter aridicollis]MBL3682172.1 QacE family quaternary ammonium compound efflux SMR transporter [Leucobacter aridicollis]NYD26778.1 small multidrug resistance pump [Leucobacter aridicollis]
MKRWLLLGSAIAAEVAGTLMLRAAVDAPAWIVGVVACYVAAFTLIGLTLRTGMPVGAVYGVWGATGVVLVAALSVLIFGEHLSPVSVAGIAVIIVGVVLVETGTHDQSAPAAERAA